MKLIDSGRNIVEMDGHTVDTRWFQGRLADRRISQRQLAKRLGLDPAAVSLMLRGKRKMSASEAAELAATLGVSVDDVLLHAGSAPTIPTRATDKAAAATGESVVAAQEVRVAPAPASGGGPVSGDGMLELPVPMADGSVARLVLPKHMTKADADRVAALVVAFAGAG